MRHNSVRVPGKNYRPLAGKPLFHHILDTLLDCQEINQVVVDTDSLPIMDSLRRDYPQVVILRRPDHLCADTIPMNEILLYDTAQVPGDLYLQTHSTNPLLRPQTVSAAIQNLLAN
jgi:CMP-N-acetylneuraminic acid synthetase